MIRAVAALVLFAAPAAAADAWPVSRGPSREPQPYRYDPAQIKRLPRAFLDDAAACVLHAGTTHLVESDGTVETVTHEVTRLNGRKGIDKLGEARNITFDPSYQKLTLNEARIHKADGRTLNVESRHVQLRDVATDFQVYDHDKQLIISFPTLEVGDVIEVKWTVRGKHPEHGGQFFTRYSFGDPTFPVALDLFRVRLPKDKPFHFASAVGKIEPERSEADGFRTWTWKAPNCRKPPQDDNLPSRERLFPAVACSTFASWKEVGQWKKKLRAECWECTPAVREVVQTVTKGLDKPEDKARALTHWLRRNVRYVSAGEKHDYTPHPPARVLANRYGDCKDTSQLLAVMLREAGLRVELATLGPQDDGQVIEAVPSPWGTHAILLVTLDGNPHWIDTTAALAGWDFLPRDDRDRLCYVVDEAGNLRLLRTPPLSAEENRVDQTTVVWVGADGSSRDERLTVAYGSAALGQRDNFLEVPAGERRRLVTAELQDANSRTRLVGLRLDEDDLRDYDRAVRSFVTFEVPNHFTGSGEREGGVADSKVWNKLLGYNLDPERTVALNLGQPFESYHAYTIHLPPAYYLESVPANKVVRAPWATFARTVRSGEREPGEPAGRTLVVEFRLRLERALIEPADFEEYRRFHEEVSAAYRAWMTLKPVQDKSEAPTLEALLRWAPEDGDSASILARLYLKHDQPADARRVLARARHYRPDEAELWELSVAAAEAPKDKEALQRELVRRFPDEARHAIKLGSILVGDGRQEEARAVLEPLTRKGPAAQRARAHFQLARSHYRRDELKPALEHWDKAAELDADTVHTVRAYHLKGRIYEEMKRPKEAEAAYKLALAVDGASELALDSLVQLELTAGNRPRALEYLRRYAVAVGDDSAGLLLAAGHYLRLKLYDEAEELAGRAVDGHPAKAHRVLGLVQFHRRAFADAAAHLSKAERGADTMEALIVSLLMLGRLPEAGKWLAAADKIESPPDGLLRTVCNEMRRLQTRRANLERLAPAPPGKTKEWAVALDHLTCAEFANRINGSGREVRELLRKALANGLEPGPALALRGLLALEQGKLRPAQADAEKAIALSPRDAGGWLVRGRVRLERGDEKAMADLEKAVELRGDTDSDARSAWMDAIMRDARPIKVDGVPKK